MAACHLGRGYTNGAVISLTRTSIHASLLAKVGRCDL